MEWQSRAGVAPANQLPPSTRLGPARDRDLRTRGGGQGSGGGGEVRGDGGARGAERGPRACRGQTGGTGQVPAELPPSAQRRVPSPRVRQPEGSAGFSLLPGPGGPPGHAPKGLGQRWRVRGGEEAGGVLGRCLGPAVRACARGPAIPAREGNDPHGVCGCKEGHVPTRDILEPQAIQRLSVPSQARLT